MSLPDGFNSTLASLTNEGLYEMFNQAEKYTSEALKAAEHEIRHRKLSFEKAEVLRSLAEQRVRNKARTDSLEHRPTNPEFNASSIYNVGTILAGKCDFRPDGSYITTKWFALGIPIAPLRTMRVMDTGGSSTILGYKSRYYVIEPLPLNHAQVLRVYLYTVSFVAAIGLTISLTSNDTAATNFLFLVVPVWALIPFGLRFAAKRWRGR